jgi:elongation factor G
MGELHLEVIVDRLRREWKVEANVGRPQVAYRETVRGRAEAEHRLVRHAPGLSPEAAVSLEVAAGAPGTGLRFAASAAVPAELAAPVESAVLAAATSGPLGGFPVTDVAVRLLAVDAGEADAAESAFKVAGALAFREALRQAGPALLEPVMTIEVTTPDEYTGDVIGDLNARRGRVTGVEARAGVQVVAAEVPLATMFGYATDLRSRTQGRATYSMKFGSYDPVPSQIAEGVLARIQGRA